MEERIIELLGANVPHTVVADAVGVDPSYISQLAEREDIKDKVTALRVEKAAKFVEHDSNIQDLERTALEKMAKLLPFQTDVMKIAKVFHILNGAKKSSDHGVLAPQQTPGAVVTLQFAKEAQVVLKLTPDKQVIEVDGRSMVPMPSHMVAAKLKEKRAMELLERVETQVAQPAISSKTRSIVDQL